MGKEKTYTDFYKKYKGWNVRQISSLVEDIRSEMEKDGARDTSENFKVLNDSSNNLKYAVLIQILEEKSSNN